MKLSNTRRRTRLLNQSPYCESPAMRTPASHKKRFSNLPTHIQVCDNLREKNLIQHKLLKLSFDILQVNALYVTFFRGGPTEDYARKVVEWIVMGCFFVGRSKDVFTISNRHP